MSTLSALADDLRQRFNAASDAWPNLTSVLVLWPAHTDPPAIPSRLKSTVDNAHHVYTRDGQKRVAIAFDFCSPLGFLGPNGMMCFWSRFRRFGLSSFFDEDSEAWVHSLDPDGERAAFDRFDALSQFANQLVDAHKCVSLPPEILAVADASLRWALSVHTLLQPKQLPLPGSGDAVVEEISDIFLASAQIIGLIERNFHLPKSTAPIEPIVRSPRGRPSKIERDLAWRDQYLSEPRQWRSIEAFAKSKRMNGRTMREALKRAKQHQQNLVGPEK